MARKSEGLTKESKELWQNLNATVFMMRKRNTPISDSLLQKIYDWQVSNEKLREEKKQILNGIMDNE